MRWLAALFLCLAAVRAGADGERAGAFDYYVLALGWSPTWCALEGDARESPQCDAGRSFGWILHGLWPQYEAGWPAHCPTTHPDPAGAETAAMADIMGTAGLARYQWRKHGRCSGLPAGAYFARARAAYAAVSRPAALRALGRPVRLPAAVIEDAFLAANPGWTKDMLTVTCRAGRIQEARLCLTRDLAPRVCGADVARDCTLEDALLAPVR